MAKPLMIHEIFEKIDQTKGKGNKAGVLRQHNSQVLRDILYASFTDIQWNLPQGTPPYEKDDAPVGHTRSNILREAKNLKQFLVTNRKLTPEQRIRTETRFIKILESVHAKDAEILIWMKDKKLQGKFNGLTESLVRQAFPVLLPPEEK